MDRLDMFLVNNGFFNSRNKAQEFISSSKIKVDGKVIKKSSFKVENPQIEILEEKIYVSRAGYKLDKFMQEIDFTIKHFKALDIGSSTGGFIEVLLEYGAKNVVAVDVGSNQLHPSLKNNDKIESLENLDIRDFRSGKRFDLITCDVSFIGVEKILPSIDRLADRFIIILFKPQFQVGREIKRSSKGVIQDKKAIEKSYKIFENELENYKWQLLTKQDSQISGKEGNIETFYYFKK